MYEFWLDGIGLGEKEAKLFSQMVNYIEPHRRRNVTVAQLKHIKNEYKSAYRTILDVYGQAKPMSTHEPSLEELVNTKVRQPDEPEKFLIPICIDKLLSHFRQGCNALSSENKLRKASYKFAKRGY